METKQISELKGDPKNPRYINKDDFEKLKQLLVKFGDLSGIVRNVRTDQLVGGHMRVEAFKALGADAQIQITQRFDQPTKDGTIALGMVVLNGQAFSYREVDWDQAFQHAANIAANRAGGDFDNDKLAELAYELSQLENGDELLQLTAMHEDEILKLLNDESAEPDKEAGDDTSRMSFSFSESQYQTVEQAIARMKATRNLQGEDNKDIDGNAIYYICRHFLDSFES